MKLRRPDLTTTRRLSTRMSPNGRLVHLCVAGTDDSLCRGDLGDSRNVFARVSCTVCARRAPAAARRRARRPLAVGIDWEPTYAKLAAMFDAGTTERAFLAVRERGPRYMPILTAKGPR